MNNMQTTKFIKQFFNRLEEREITYCILRGYTGLPKEAGRDIDICIQNIENLDAVISQLILELGWQYKQTWNRDGFKTYICSLCQENNVSVLQLDFWTSFRWRGIAWCDERQILKDLRKINGFFVASEGAEAVVTAIKELVGGGRIKPKYYNSISCFAERNKNKFIACLSPTFKDYAEYLWELCAKSEFAKMDREASKIKRKLMQRNFLRYLRYSFKAFGIRLKNLLVPRGKLIAFVGPDGSGKTTIMEKTGEYLQLFFPQQKKFHIRYNIFPELRTGHGFSSMKGKINEDANAQHKEDKTVTKRSAISILASWFVVGYYTLEFCVGNFWIFILKRKNILVLYDRYYYDHFIQPTTRDLIFPFRKLLLLFVTKPDIVIHLNADAKTVYARKQELSMREIEKQNIYINKILQEVQQSYCIDTDNKCIEQVASAAFEKIYHNL